MFGSRSRRRSSVSVLVLASLAQLLLAAPPPPAPLEHAAHRKPLPKPKPAPRELVPLNLEPPPPPPPAITDVKNRRCTDYLCSIELCLPIEDCDGVVMDKATECGCCPLCIKYLDKGRACGRHGVLRFPERPTTMCRPPLNCVDGYCAMALGEDDEEGQEQKSLRRGAKPAKDERKPEKPLPEVLNAIDE